MHSRPIEGISNRGDAERLAYACEAFIEVLSRDPRVEAFYRRLRQDCGLGPLAARIRERQAYRDDPSEEDVADVLALHKALELMESDTAPFVRQLSGLVQDVLHLSYSWLPRVLLARFAVWIIEEARGERQLLQMRVPSRPWSQLGRKPRHGGGDIARNIHWYYRVNVKQPPDTKAQVAREYASAEGRHTNARSVVQNGIKQAMALLDLVVVDETPK